MSDKKNILVVTTSFPRFEGDVVGGGGFIYELCQTLKGTYNIFVLAPAMEGTTAQNRINGIYVKRFNYLPQKWSGLIGKSSIIENLRINKSKLFLIPLFLTFNLISILQ